MWRELLHYVWIGLGFGIGFTIAQGVCGFVGTLLKGK
jgi:hypothetical protein